MIKNNIYEYIYNYIFANLKKDYNNLFYKYNIILLKKYIEKYIKEYINIMYKYKYNNSTIKYNKQVEICEKPGLIIYKTNFFKYKKNKINLFKPLYKNYNYKSGIITPNGNHFVSLVDESPDFTYSIYKYIYFRLKIKEYYTTDLKGLIDYKRRQLFKKSQE